MRAIKGVSLTNPTVKVYATDEPDENAGNASHQYVIQTHDAEGELVHTQTISFQHGPVREAGHNGIPDVALYAVLLDRLAGFQSSQWRNRPNAISATKLEEALMWQQKRTLDRMARDVEGTNAV